MNILKRIISKFKRFFNKKPILVCPECGARYDYEPRVAIGLKCAKCAYNDHTSRPYNDGM